LVTVAGVFSRITRQASVRIRSPEAKLIRDLAFNAWFAVRRRARVLLLATLTMEACTSWTTQQRPVTQVVEPKHPSSVRVTTTDGKVWRVDRPRMVGDSLQGITPDSLVVSIAVARITKIDARQFSPGHTIAFGLAMGLILFFVAALYAIAGKNGDT
jgi:hypothetical protein